MAEKKPRLPRRQRHHPRGHDMCGTPSEQCLFAEPWVPHDIQQQSWEGVDDIRQQSEKADDRSFAILHAIVIEWRIDKLLELLIPRYDLIRRFNFGTKIKLLKAMTLIPDHVVDAAHLCMDIRNQFAHNLKLSSFEHDSIRNDFRSHLEDFLRRGHLLPTDRAQKKARQTAIRAASMRELYSDVNRHCTMALLLYRHNVHLLGERMRSDEFYWGLFDEADRRRMAETDALLARIAMLPTVDENGNVIYDPRAAKKDEAGG